MLGRAHHKSRRRPPVFFSPVFDREVVPVSRCVAISLGETENCLFECVNTTNLRDHSVHFTPPRWGQPWVVGLLFVKIALHAFVEVHTFILNICCTGIYSSILHKKVTLSAYCSDFRIYRPGSSRLYFLNHTCGTGAFLGIFRTWHLTAQLRITVRSCT